MQPPQNRRRLPVPRASTRSFDYAKELASEFLPSAQDDRFLGVRLTASAPEVLLLLYLYSQFLQLRLAHRRRRIHHQIHCARGLGKWNHFAQAVCAGQNHHDAIQSERNSAVRRRAILQRFQKEPEARARLFLRHPESAEYLALNVLAMNTDRARAQLGAIQHHVISQRTNFAQRRLGIAGGVEAGFELGHVFIVQRSKGMMGRIPAPGLRSHSNMGKSVTHRKR